jgi:hypothetical protein
MTGRESVVENVLELVERSDSERDFYVSLHVVVEARHGHLPDVAFLVSPDRLTVVSHESSVGTRAKGRLRRLLFRPGS